MPNKRVCPIVTFDHGGWDAAADLRAFLPGFSKSQFQINDLSVAIRWLPPGWHHTLVGGGATVGLRRLHASATHEESDEDWFVWDDCIEIDKQKIGGRLVHFRHVWTSVNFSRTNAGAPDVFDGFHKWAWTWPVDRMGVLMQVFIQRRGFVYESETSAEMQRILSNLTLYPTDPGHLIEAHAEIASGKLQITAVALDKITKPWGTIQPCPLTNRRSWTLRLSSNRIHEPVNLSPKGASIDEKIKNADAFAERWGAVLSDIDRWIDRTENTLREVAAEENIQEEKCSVTGCQIEFDYSCERLTIYFSAWQEDGHESFQGFAELDPDGRLTVDLE